DTSLARVKKLLEGYAHRLSQNTLLMAVAQHVQRIPAPIDAVALDMAVLDLHDLHEVHLLSVGGLPGVFPRQYAAVGEEALLESLALRRIGRENLRDEFP